MSKIGFIYKLCSINPDIKEIYIGSTTDLINRKSHHKHRCNNNMAGSHHLKVYEFIRDNGTFTNWEIVELEKVDYENLDDLRKKERYYIDLLKPFLNTKVPTRTGKEWRKIYREEHKEEIQEQEKKYREEHKEEIHKREKKYREEHKEERQKYTKKYREEHKEELKKFRDEHKDKKREQDKKYNQEHKDQIKEQRKKYREEHKEELKEKKKIYQEEHKEDKKNYDKQYREEHKEAINEKRNKKINCNCGGKYTTIHKALHLRTKKHIEYTEKEKMRFC